MGVKRGQVMEVPGLRRQGTARQLVVGGKPFLMIGGEVHNSSSSSLGYMKAVWAKLAGLHCNTVLAPISWELIEPEEGRFELGLVTGLVEGARRAGMKLVPLWFGTWKNATSSYAPGWVKRDLGRFGRAQRKAGENSTTISCMSEAAREADGRAFAALMRHIRKIDAGQQTVVMVQVENEVGLLGAARDHCAAAEAAFGGAVDGELMGYLRERRGELRPELVSAWAEMGNRDGGTWGEVFGEVADEAFMAWHSARFVEHVAAAGAAEYGLPMFANAWLVQFGGQAAGDYPSGGPVSRMRDVWRAGAPHIAVLAPDIYLEDFAGVCADYARGGEGLLIPEARRDHGAPANAFYALAEHDAMCFAPFGIDSLGAPDPAILNVAPGNAASQNATANATLLAESFRLLNDMMAVIAANQGTGRMRGVLQRGDEPVEMELGGYRLRVRFNEGLRANVTPAGGLIIAEGPGEFLVAGHGFGVDFLPKDGEKGQVDILSLEEGDFRKGKWVAGRRLNGDEYALRLERAAGARRIKVFSLRDQLCVR